MNVLFRAQAQSGQFRAKKAVFLALLAAMPSCASRQESLEERIDVRVDKRIEERIDELNRKNVTEIDISTLDGKILVVDTEYDTTGRKERERKKVFDFTKKDSTYTIEEAVDSIKIVNTIEDNSTIEVDKEESSWKSTFWSILDRAVNAITILILVCALIYFLVKKVFTSDDSQSS